jgi:hypothetical protein
MANATEITIKVEGSEEITAMLSRLPVLTMASGGPIDRAVKRAADVVIGKAKQIVPQSSLTGSRRKQSKKSKAIWSKKLKSMLRVKQLKYEQSTWAIVGAKNPEGNHAFFMQEKPRRHVLWGKATAVAKYRIQRNWITQAFDETLSQQRAEMVASLKEDIDATWRHAS